MGGFNNETELTSNLNVYAVGDILEGMPELTPVAQKSAEFIARRIKAKKNVNKAKKILYSLKIFHYREPLKKRKKNIN